MSSCCEEQKSEHIEVARENGCAWNEVVCEWAADNGDFSTLKWAREHGCSWGSDTLIRAALKGNITGDFEMVKWVLLNGQWDAAALQRVLKNPEIAVWMLDHQDKLPLIKQCGPEIVEIAIQHDNLEFLERCEKEGFVLDGTTWKEAAKYGADKVAQWLLERKIPLDPKSFVKAAWDHKQKDIFLWACSHLQPTKIKEAL